MVQKAKKITRNLTINISRKTIIFTVFFLIGLKLIYESRDTLALLFITFLLIVAISPLVSFLEKKRISRSISSFVILLMIFSAITGTVASLISPLLTQTQLFLERFPELVGRLAPYHINMSTFTSSLNSIPGNFLQIALDTFSGLVTFFTLLVISYYVLQSRPRWPEHFQSLFGQNADKYYHITTEIETRLGHWVRGELLLMISVGFANYVGFVLIGLPFAVPLSIIAGFLELIPNIGPTIAAIPAVLVGFSISPTLGILAILVSLIVQQLENNFLVPRIMNKIAGLNPIITILAILIGYRLGGATLAVLSLPLVICIEVILRHLKFNQHTQQPEID
jgi:predicted PurR-regulated permease PerM